jgi:hypothetical protein
MNKNTSLFTKILPFFIILGIIMLILTLNKKEKMQQIKIDGPNNSPFESK